MMTFPQSSNDFKKLADEGKTVVCTETTSEDVKPAVGIYGSDWSFWSMKHSDQGSEAVWRKIMTIQEAADLETKL